MVPRTITAQFSPAESSSRRRETDDSARLRPSLARQLSAFPKSSLPSFALPPPCHCPRHHRATSAFQTCRNDTLFEKEVAEAQVLLLCGRSAFVDQRRTFACDGRSGRTGHRRRSRGAGRSAFCSSSWKERNPTYTESANHRAESECEDESYSCASHSRESIVLRADDRMGTHCFLLLSTSETYPAARITAELTN